MANRTKWQRDKNGVWRVAVAGDVSVGDVIPVKYKPYRVTSIIHRSSTFWAGEIGSHRGRQTLVSVERTEVQYG